MHGTVRHHMHTHGRWCGRRSWMAVMLWSNSYTHGLEPRAPREQGRSARAMPGHAGMSQPHRHACSWRQVHGFCVPQSFCRAPPSSWCLRCIVLCAECTSTLMSSCACFQVVTRVARNHLLTCVVQVHSFIGCRLRCKGPPLLKRPFNAMPGGACRASSSHAPLPPAPRRLGRPSGASMPSTSSMATAAACVELPPIASAGKTSRAAIA